MFPLFKKAFFIFGVLVTTTILTNNQSIAATHHGHARTHRMMEVGKSRLFAHARHGLHVAARAHGRVRLSRLHRSHRLRYARATNPGYAGPGSDYVPTSSGPVSSYVQTGGASFYSGGRTAGGGSVGAATCAHRSLPFGTRVLVTNLANQRTAVLTVNDRGPFVRGRVVDVSRGAAGTLGMLQSGVAHVRLEVLGRAG